MTWLRKAGYSWAKVEELILADIHKTLNVSYNEDLQLRIEMDPTYEEHVAQFNFGAATGTTEISAELASKAAAKPDEGPPNVTIGDNATTVDAAYGNNAFTTDENAFSALNKSPL